MKLMLLTWLCGGVLRAVLALPDVDVLFSRYPVFSLISHLLTYSLVVSSLCWIILFLKSLYAGSRLPVVLLLWFGLYMYIAVAIMVIIHRPCLLFKSQQVCPYLTGNTLRLR
jgi:hypothetical protein